MYMMATCFERDKVLDAGNGRIYLKSWNGYYLGIEETSPPPSSQATQVVDGTCCRIKDGSAKPAAKIRWNAKPFAQLCGKLPRTQPGRVSERLPGDPLS